MTKQTKQERRELWAKALESGEYTQIKGRLRTDSGFCALGVGCDVYVRAHPHGLAWRPRPIGGAEWEIARHVLNMPAPIAQWFGTDLNRRMNISHANDAADKTFAEIAGLVRL